jgi:hypothetical protein
MILWHRQVPKNSFMDFQMNGVGVAKSRNSYVRPLPLSTYRRPVTSKCESDSLRSR